MFFCRRATRETATLRTCRSLAWRVRVCLGFPRSNKCGSERFQGASAALQVRPSRQARHGAAHYCARPRRADVRGLRCAFSAEGGLMFLMSFSFFLSFGSSRVQPIRFRALGCRLAKWRKKITLDFRDRRLWFGLWFVILGLIFYFI